MNEREQEMLYRYVTSGEGVWSAGKRLLPDELVDEANENRKWLKRPELPEGNYRFFMTEAGKEMYEKTLKRVHEKYLPNIELSETPRLEVQDIAYEDEFQVVERIPRIDQEDHREF